jgi:hypothetical protein
MSHDAELTHGLIYQRMQADHARIRELLEGVCSPDGIDFGAYQRFRGGLLRHIAIEDNILAPAVKKLREGVDLPALRQSKLENAALASMLVPTPTNEIVARLQKLLVKSDKFAKGPEGLYAELERIEGADLEALCRRMDSAPAASLAAYRDGPKTFEAIEKSMLAAGWK